jgi:hypothetical protein
MRKIENRDRTRGNEAPMVIPEHGPATVQPDGDGRAGNQEEDQTIATYVETVPGDK